MPCPSTFIIPCSLFDILFASVPRPGGSGYCGPEGRVGDRVQIVGPLPPERTDTHHTSWFRRAVTTSTPFDRRCPGDIHMRGRRPR